MLIENAAPRIGAIVTGTDVRSLTEGDWKRLAATRSLHRCTQPMTRCPSN